MLGEINKGKENMETPTIEKMEFILQRYKQKYNRDSFEESYKSYQDIPSFKINENVHQVSEFNDRIHYIMRLETQYYLTKAFEAMKVDMLDENVEEKNDNIGTPGRVAKMWCGSNTNDDRELLSGRWAQRPRLASFPSNMIGPRIPITKRVDLTAVCSHHLAPFSTTFREDAYAVISYIPDGMVLGISKLQRLVDWMSQRGWLQEDLTREIYNEISAAARTSSVYVKLVNVVHTCESLRGAKSKDGAFTTEYYGGDFEDFRIRTTI